MSELPAAGCVLSIVDSTDGAILTAPVSRRLPVAGPGICFAFPLTTHGATRLLT